MDFKMKKYFALTSLIHFAWMVTLAATASAQSLTAFEIMQKVDQRYEGESSLANSTMILIDKRDRQRTRTLKQYSKEYDDHTRYMAYFVAPSDLKDTVYINHDWNGSAIEDDSWLYLPALKKNKRIAASDRSGPFLGSDFSYADLSGFELDWYDYKIIKESDMVNGHDCWVIEYTAKPEFSSKVLETTRDTKTHTWVRKDIFFQVKSKIWKARANQIKYYSASNIEKIDGIWTAKKMQMVTTKNGKKQHASVLLIDDVVYQLKLSDDIFKSENMQRAAFAD